MMHFLTELRLDVFILEGHLDNFLRDMAHSHKSSLYTINKVIRINNYETLLFY